MNRFVNDKRNLTMLMDFYELTMSNGYFVKGLKDKCVVFDMFYRRNPDEGGFVIFAGLEQLVNYIQNLSFDEEDIEYLRSKNMFDEGFLDYLSNFKFSGDIYAVPEGTIVYPNTPLVTVVAPLIDAQLIETMLLLTINHQSLIATKANRIVRAAGDASVMEFGARRAQGSDAAIYGARACYIGGVGATATAISDELFGVPAIGTMAHSFVQFFDTEYEAFKAYAEVYPDNCVLLIDTYNVLESGVQNAIKVAKEVLEPMGKRLKGIRIDSGDLAYLTKKVRKILDAAGCEDCSIVVSNSIDEYLITSLYKQGARIDSYGVGERMITAKSEPVFGGVYKLAAVKDAGSTEFTPKIKLSENTEKVTNPGNKTVYRLYNKKTGKIRADLICLADEKLDADQNMVLFDPIDTWKKTKVLGGTYEVRELLVPVIREGKRVYESPSVMELREYCQKEQNTLWDESRRFVNPQKVYVDLSQKLWDLKKNLLEEMSEKSLN